MRRILEDADNGWLHSLGVVPRPSVNTGHFRVPSAFGLAAYSFPDRPAAEIATITCLVFLGMETVLRLPPC